jgi:carbon-monoxide dehydrogenase large subunit
MLPAAGEVPRMKIMHQHSPSPLNPFGVKGVGEGGPIAPPAAIANAIADALRPLRVTFDVTPIAPHHVVEAVRAASAGHS